MKKLITLLLLTVPFAVIGQGKPQKAGLTSGYGIMIGQHIEADTTVQSFAPFNLTFPKLDTSVRIYYVGPFIVVSMSVKGGAYYQVAAKDVDGKWVFNKSANSAMDALYFAITHSK